jgi:triosephosphate isomerase
MEKRLIIANWKARKTSNDALSWLDTLEQSEVLSEYSHTILLAAPFTLLYLLSTEIKKRNLSIMLCAQDISSFPSGSYTGEVPAELVKEFAGYTLIGHSERREKLQETEDMLVRKVEQATRAALTPIYCVQNSQERIPQGVEIVAYEPPGAIGNGETASLADVENIARKITASSQQNLAILYGGSVDTENVASFMHSAELSGVLVGTKSIEVSDFIALLRAAK